MQVSILQGSATGSVVFSETYSPSPQTSANGLVTLEVGSGTPVTGSFAGINWAGGPFYFKTETDPAGGKMKETGTTHRESPSTGATVECGFPGLPGGYRNLNGSLEGVGDPGNWWYYKGTLRQSTWPPNDHRSG